MEKGFYRYCLFDNRPLYTYVVGQLPDKSHTVMTCAELPLWLEGVGKKDWLPDGESCHEGNGFKQRLGMPYFPYYEKVEAEEVPIHLSDDFTTFSLLESDKPYIGWLFRVMSDFEHYATAETIPLTDTFRYGLLFCQKFLPFDLGCRLVTHWFRRYATHANRLQILLHTGIAPYLRNESRKDGLG